MTIEPRRLERDLDSGLGKAYLSALRTDFSGVAYSGTNFFHIILSFVIVKDWISLITTKRNVRDIL